MRLLRLPTLCAETGKGKTSVYNDIKRGLCEPRAVKDGPGFVARTEEQRDRYIANLISSVIGGKADMARTCQYVR